jgi:hypothetical protein
MDLSNILYKSNIRGFSNVLPHCSKIKLSEPSVNRSGIIPYCMKDDIFLIALGLNNFRKTLTVIGGQYDDSDFDLLSTAVREFNEESGGLLNPVKEEDLLDSYVIVSSYSYTFLVKTEYQYVNKSGNDGELSTIIWLTLEQLKSLSNQKRHDLYTFSYDLNLILYRLLGTKYSKSDKIPLRRTKKMNISEGKIFYNDVENFELKSKFMLMSDYFIANNLRTICIKANEDIFVFDIFYSKDIENIINYRKKCFILNKDIFKYLQLKNYKFLDLKPNLQSKFNREIFSVVDLTKIVTIMKKYDDENYHILKKESTYGKAKLEFIFYLSYCNDVIIKNGDSTLYEIDDKYINMFVNLKLLRGYDNELGFKIYTIYPLFIEDI